MEVAKDGIALYEAYNRYSRVIAQAEILKSSGQTDEATTAKLVTRPSKRWIMVGAAAAAVIVFAITISAGGTPIPGSGVSATAAEPLVKIGRASCRERGCQYV